MVKSCLVATCKNTLGKSGITFHKIGKKRYANRLKAIGRSVDECLSPQNVICSKHYAEEDFIYFNGKKYLRLEAMPRFFIPRRPVIEQTTEIISSPASQLPEISNNSTNTDIVNVSSGDVWLMYTDLWILTPQNDNIDTIMNQENLSQYPTNEFLSSLMSDGCENLEFDMSLGPLES
ncbi:uncharacterized protein LOC108917069 [Anoplophora glabripennis]|uniref:uncharacterized protein LOC108917069 n=1 Tax=Anoplophora glabripennis TaxID=217634 RepID=UPI000873FA4B|nr:uncharacterized protein LOC108917069 [Anoplophora glabripennis]XP_018579017.1 uncharacterized protein LOC108917069 [Anoplophora glabripennis]